MLMIIIQQLLQPVVLLLSQAVAAVWSGERRVEVKRQRFWRRLLPSLRECALPRLEWFPNISSRFLHIIDIVSYGQWNCACISPPLSAWPSSGPILQACSIYSSGSPANSISKGKPTRLWSAQNRQHDRVSSRSNSWNRFRAQDYKKHDFRLVPPSRTKTYKAEDVK